MGIFGLSQQLTHVAVSQVLPLPLSLSLSLSHLFLSNVPGSGNGQQEMASEVKPGSGVMNSISLYLVAIPHTAFPSSHLYSGLIRHP